MEGESGESGEVSDVKSSKVVKIKKTEISPSAPAIIKGKSMTERFRENPWVVATLALGVVTLILLMNNFGSITGSAITGGAVVVPQSEVEGKILDFINAQVDTPVSIVETNMVSGLYEVVVLYQGQEVPIYVTADGKNVVQGLTPLDLLAQQGTGAAGIGGSTEPTSAQVVDVSLDDDPILGDPNAPVTIIEFSDYQCPFCSKFLIDTLPLIKTQYIDTGKVKFVYRDFPLSSIHPYAQKAAEAAECADVQGKYWEYHDNLFGNQNALDIASLKKYAQDLKLNTDKFNTCLDSGEMAGEVANDLDDGIAAGVQGTPGFFINGRFLGGAYPFEQFKVIIDEELAKKSA